MYFNDNFLDKLAYDAKNSSRLRMNLDLRDTDKDHSQRMLNALEPGTEIPIHRHSDTSETVIILRGQLDEIYYDENGTETQRFRLSPSDGKYGLQIPAKQWHSLVVIEPSVIIEMKNGPYVPRKDEDILNR